MLLLFLVIWADDTFAYLVGHTMGRKVLFPSISPKKTLEGSVAGLVGSLLVAWGFARLFWQTASLKTVILLAGLVALFGQIGDLAESAMKRGANLKDSGSVLPGHGGLLDRVDSLLFGAPVLWLALAIYGHMAMTKGLCILGSTGSIGRQCLWVVKNASDRFHVVALCAGKNLELLAQQVRDFAPKLVVVGNSELD